VEKSGASMVVGNARVLVDGEEIYRIEKARVGTFGGIAYDDYPLSSEHSRGGRMER
jgi:3-hydroxyacyl-[acyl-carrier protein] dehydratase/trans-2-decenoyl-[acyl-carrier protein] isomerase